MSEARASRERLERHGIRPNRELGQNFLVDDNILGVIGRLAELHPDDVVLEIGGGLGVLSAYLATRVAHLHVIETDTRLAPVLEEALAGTGAQLHLADVMEARPHGARSGARQGGGEPALRRRRPGAHADDRPSCPASGCGA